MPELVICRTCKESVPLWEWYTGCPNCKAIPEPTETPEPETRMLHQKLEALAQKFRDGSWILELERDLTGGSL